MIYWECFRLKVIGVTGGVGSGKSQILAYMEKKYRAYVIRTDELAQELMQPGTDLYGKLQKLFRGQKVFDSDGRLIRAKAAELIFADSALRMQMNDLVHPAVKAEVTRQIADRRKEGACSYFVVEAALLIEDGYKKICDELWYIYTDEKHRRKRLRESRSYSDEKIDAIFASQLSEEVFRRNCTYVIDNSGSVEEAYRQIRSILGNGII